MTNTEIGEMTLIGLSLKKKTTNANGQSAIDCGNLWQQFEKENYAKKIPVKLTNEMLAVYYQYEGDHTKPFSYFIGCKVNAGIEIPQGMDCLHVPQGIYQKIIAKGKMPDCVANAWKGIWGSDIPRAYQYDFEIYDDRSKDWSSAEVDIFLSVT